MAKNKVEKCKYIPLCDISVVKNIKQLTIILKQNKLKPYNLKDLELGEQILLNSVAFN